MFWPTNLLVGSQRWKLVNCRWFAANKHCCVCVFEPNWIQWSKQIRIRIGIGKKTWTILFVVVVSNGNFCVLILLLFSFIWQVQFDIQTHTHNPIGCKHDDGMLPWCNHRQWGQRKRKFCAPSDLGSLWTEARVLVALASKFLYALPLSSILSLCFGHCFLLGPSKARYLQFMQLEAYAISHWSRSQDDVLMALGCKSNCSCVAHSLAHSLLFAPKNTHSEITRNTTQAQMVFFWVGVAGCIQEAHTYTHCFAHTYFAEHETAAKIGGGLLLRLN